MIKINSIFISYTLINCIFCHAMEVVPLINKENYETITIEDLQDIPLKLSFENIRPYFNHKKKQQQYATFCTTKNQNNKRLEDSLSFCVATLPPGIPLKIITFMLDNDEKAAEIFYKSPLYYAFCRYHKVKKTIQNLSLQNQPPIALFFKLPIKLQQAILQEVNNSQYNYFYPPQTISQDRLNTIKNFSSEVQEAFFTHQNIMLIDNATHFSYTHNIKSLAILGLLIGCTIGFSIVLPIIFTYHLEKQWVPLIVATPILMGIFTCIICGFYSKKRLAKHFQKRLKPINEELTIEELEGATID